MIVGVNVSDCNVSDCFWYQLTWAILDSSSSRSPDGPLCTPP